jgi:hypothetical protein
MQLKLSNKPVPKICINSLQATAVPYMFTDFHLTTYSNNLL